MGRNRGALLVGTILAVLEASCVPPEPPPPSCEARVSLDRISAGPARITPDANGIFDEALIQAMVRVQDLGLACAGLDGLMLQFIDVEVDLVDHGGQGSAIRRFRETIPLTGELCENDRCNVNISYSWDGRDDRGETLPDGERILPRVRVGLAVLSDPSGQPKLLSSDEKATSSIEVAMKHDTAEDAWLEVEAIEAGIGTRAEDPEALPNDWPYRYEGATASTLTALANALARARRLDLPAAFDERLQHVLANAEITVKPNATQLAAWEALFLKSYGSTEVEWGDRGAPEAVWLLDAGPAQGQAVQVARAYLSSKESGLRALFGMDADESFRFHQVIGADDDPVVAVRYRHDVRVPQTAVDAAAGGDPKEQTIPVAGDELLLWVRRFGAGKDLGRVLSLTARWTRGASRPTALLPSKAVEAIGVAASGLPGATVVKVEGPVLVSIGSSGRHVHTSVYVAGGGELLDVGVDAESGDVCYVRNGRRENRLTANFNPATQETVYGFADSVSGLPHARICPRGATRADQCVESDATGYYDPAVLGPGGTAATVHLHGRYFREYSVELDAPAYSLHPRYSATIDATLPSTELHLDHLHAGIAD